MSHNAHRALKQGETTIRSRAMSDISDACRNDPLLLQLTAWLQQQDLHQDAGEGLTIEV